MSKPTHKQAKFIEGIANGKTATQAVVDAGYEVKDRIVAKSIGSENLTKPYIKQELAMVLSTLNINIYNATKPIADALTATKMIVMGKESNESFVDVIPDHAIRLRAGKEARELLRITDTEDDNTPPVDLTPELKAAIERGDVSEMQRVVFRDKEGTLEPIK